MTAGVSVAVAFDEEFAVVAVHECQAQGFDGVEARSGEAAPCGCGWSARQTRCPPTRRRTSLQASDVSASCRARGRCGVTVAKSSERGPDMGAFSAVAFAGVSEDVLTSLTILTELPLVGPSGLGIARLVSLPVM